MITTGVTGGTWRASVNAWGAIEPWDGSPVLDWHVAADDRWHTPADEPAVRQKRLGGTAVVETRVRIPEGDAVHRVYSVAAHGGLTIVEVENASPLPIAVAFTRGDLLTALPPTAPIQGITLPSGSIAVPVGHKATVTVALRHTHPAAGTLPGGMPTATGVVRGWTTTTEQASRLLLPDAPVGPRVVAARCELLLNGPAHPDDDPVAFLIALGQLVRMGDGAAPWVPDVAHALEMAAKGDVRDWTLAAALDAAEIVLARAGEERARRDLGAMRLRLAPSLALPADEPLDATLYALWVERRLGVATGAGGDLLPAGLPVGWEGTNFEVYGLPTSADSTVSFAVRWHGARPAVLWEQTGGPVQLRASALAPEWVSADVKGETLWPVPPGLAPADGGSFS
ncbi:MAG: hypothetical protein Q7V57_09780 [Actinomycetota bacterium]|nr:hypothetical protein [Actinomycetota bacterium]